MEYLTEGGMPVDKETIVKHAGAFLIGVYQENGSTHHESYGRIIVNEGSVLLRITKSGETEMEMYVQHPIYPTKQDLRFAIGGV